MQLSGFDIKMLFGTRHPYSERVVKICENCTIADCNECPIDVEVDENAKHAVTDPLTVQMCSHHTDKRIRNFKFKYD
jgi:hypothetical protein